MGLIQAKLAALKTLTSATGKHNELEWKWLSDLNSDTTLTLEGQWLKYLSGLGYTGTVDEMKIASWKDLGYAGTFNELEEQFWTGGGSYYSASAKSLGGASISDYYSSSEGFIDTNYTGMTLAFTFYPMEYQQIGSGYPLFYAGNNNFAVGYNNGPSGTFGFQTKYGGLTQLLVTDAESPRETFAIDQWHSVLFCLDGFAGKASVWVDGSEAKSWTFSSGRTYNDHGASTTDLFVGFGGAHGLECYLSDVWCDNQYLAPETYWASFFDSNNKPKNLGNDGSAVTGSQPLTYFRGGDPTSNLGSLSDWTEVGTVADAPASP